MNKFVLRMKFEKLGLGLKIGVGPKNWLKKGFIAFL
jgi:hypothetical protein